MINETSLLLLMSPWLYINIARIIISIIIMNLLAPSEHMLQKMRALLRNCAGPKRASASWPRSARAAYRALASNSRIQHSLPQSVASNSRIEHSLLFCIRSREQPAPAAAALLLLFCLVVVLAQQQQQHHTITTKKTLRAFF